MMRGMRDANPFPNAPPGWNEARARRSAAEAGLALDDDHWRLIRALQEYYRKAERPALRQIKDALEECFHSKGGMKHLYRICPGGPVAQGCVLAGLEVPPGAVDKSFGSVA
ncbi:MAG: TusE/DsrC/DsvC family sulfur relay protein [Gammaproteobacteria bacterium]